MEHIVLALVPNERLAEIGFNEPLTNQEIAGAEDQQTLPPFPLPHPLAAAVLTISDPILLNSTAATATAGEEIPMQEFPPPPASFVALDNSADAVAAAGSDSSVGASASTVVRARNSLAGNLRALAAQLRKK